MGVTVFEHSPKAKKSHFIYRLNPYSLHDLFVVDNRPHSVCKVFPDGHW